MSIQAASADRLTIKGLNVQLGRMPILIDVNLDLPLGGMVGIVGPNGSGKTTLLSAIMGLIRPAGGEIRLGPQSLPGLSRRAAARIVTLMPQDTRLDSPFSVRDIIAMGRTPYLGRFDGPSAADEAIIAHALREARVDDLANRAVNSLSGGERQRVLFARAIAQETPVLLLDEATSSLDVCYQIELMELARHLADQGKLVVASIHDLGLASRYCDRLVIMFGGRVVADGRPSAVLTELNLQRYFSLVASVGPAAPPGRGLSIVPLASIRPAGAQPLQNPDA